MKKRLGCIHAHYSNIDYINHSLSPYNIELIHFVDPGLLYRVTSDENFHQLDAQRKVKEQVEWIAKCNVDAILITCTNYIAMLQEDPISIQIPIIKIDEPYFEYICNTKRPQTIFFTNPATVDGTMKRLMEYANRNKKALGEIEVINIDNTFELIMLGLKDEYNQEISKVIREKISSENKIISVAQLSMVEASQLVEYETSKTIVNPMKTLLSSIVDRLELEENR